MEFADLEYFICVADMGSFSKASRLLHVSQPALSLGVRRLEKELGTELITRSTRQMELTDAGELFCKNAKLMLHQRDSTVSRIRSLSAPEPERIRIGISPFYSKYYLPRLLKKLSSMPGIKFIIKERISAELEKGLLSGDIDISFVPLEPASSDLEYKVLCIEEILLAVPRSYEVNLRAIQGNTLSYIDLAEVKDLPFVSLMPIQKISSLITGVCLEAGFTPHVVYETLDWDTVNIMIANDIGVGFVPDILFHKDDGEKTPNYYRIANRQVTRHYAAAWAKGKTLTDAQSNIIKIFRECLSETRPVLG